ncbi:hypothetical protein BDW74DRAFT_174327 [Aspergillus multicolor]|uniref:uncharacterized protein n=1 Tax=Aspergillus multicolor TaxID=41759 RepID=UPI003CCD0F19
MARRKKLVRIAAVCKAAVLGYREFEDSKPEPPINGHGAVSIKLSSPEETWVLDVTSAQFGFRDTLEPIRRYKAARKCGKADVGSSKYVENLTTDIDKTTKGVGAVYAAKEMSEAERPSRLRFAAFMDTAVDKHFIDETPAEFEKKLKDFKGALKLHMRI